MIDHVARAASLKAEATKLLEDLALLDLLGRHGIVQLTGSYRYDLMTKRDIDICVAIENPGQDVAFAMGCEISKLPGVGSMYYRNEYVLHTPGNPLALFWCVDVHLEGTEQWKVDILVATPGEVNRVVSAGERLLHGLDEEKRARILAIKGQLSTSKDYGKAIKSTDIYDAVMTCEVKDLAGWKAWWRYQVIKGSVKKN